MRHCAKMRISSVNVTKFAVHCMKSVRIRSYSGPHFPAFGLNTERYFVSLRIQSECGELPTRITPNMDPFCVVVFRGYDYIYWENAQWKASFFVQCVEFGNVWKISGWWGRLCLKDKDVDFWKLTSPQDIIALNSPAGNYMFKVNNRNTGARCEICSKLTRETQERRH